MAAKLIMSTHVPVLVVGAGISGLVCGYSLRKSGIDALVVESSMRPGGLIRSEQREGYLLELGPQSFSAASQLLDLCQDLKIRDQLLEAPPRAPRLLLVNGQLRQVPLSPPAFFASSLFGIATKWTILRDALGRTSPPDADESIAAFTRRKFSSELLDKLVGPFVSGIYAGDPEKLSLRSAFPQLYEAERTSGSIVRGMIRAAKSKSGQPQRPTLQTFRNGNDTLVQALAASLGSALRTETSATQIQYNASAPTRTSSGNFVVTLTTKNSSEQIIADNVVLATPAAVSASLLRPLSPELLSNLASIEYAPIAVVSLGYAKSAVGQPLDGFGFLIPRSARLRTLGTVWNSSLFPERAPKEQVLLTSFLGGATDSQAAALSPDEISSLVHREISPILQIRESPAFSNVTLFRRALPQYNLGYADRLASIQKLSVAFPGLFFTGNYLRGPSVGACIEHALSLAEGIRAGARKATAAVG